MDTNTYTLLNPIVWIDLELTGQFILGFQSKLGLDPEKDHIVEIAVIITDGELKQQIVGPNLVIHYPGYVLEGMSPWCISIFSANGLLQDIRNSTLTLSEVEEVVLQFIKKYVPPNVAPLGGSSCHCDRAFIHREMPLLDAYLHEDNLDVSSLRQCCKRWKKEVLEEMTKQGRHRGLDDIKESIAELKLYKQKLFIQQAYCYHKIHGYKIIIKQMIKQWWESAKRGFGVLKQPLRFFGAWKEMSRKVNETVEKIARNFRGVPIAKILVGINVGGYFLYSLTNERVLNRLLYNPLLANFVNPGLIRCVVNSGIMYFLASYFERMNGPSALLKVILLSLFQSTVLCAIAKYQDGEFYYSGNDAIIRGVLFSILLKDPAAKLVIIPFPIPMRCFIIAVVITLVDLLRFNVPAFGGIGAGILYVKQFI
eukprot:TRINITY_DN88420_c0_g1_i1.p1 TRINITY_DN88420_c0_g1~~TRINITY_DN88420_c0_g1_i1.p1  ORF type:complete len:424 (+),score=20.60 TRINITY_DN88420_c0_g1_i1:77-1348(+)